MREKIVEAGSEVVKSYLGSYTAGVILIGGGVLMASLWYGLGGKNTNDSLDNFKRYRNKNELRKKIKELSNNLVTTPSENISDDYLQKAEALCCSVKEMFKSSLSENHFLYVDLRELERNINEKREVKECVNEILGRKNNNGF